MGVRGGGGVRNWNCENMFHDLWKFLEKEEGHFIPKHDFWEFFKLKKTKVIISFWAIKPGAQYLDFLIVVVLVLDTSTYR